MGEFKPTDAVGEAVANPPALACPLERFELVYSANGKKTLKDACLKIAWKSD